MPVKISGVLPEGLDALVRKVLHQALSGRAQNFTVHVSQSHRDVVVDIREPFEKKVKFTGSAALEIARALQAILADILDEECGPAPAR